MITQSLVCGSNVLREERNRRNIYIHTCRADFIFLSISKSHC